MIGFNPYGDCVEAGGDGPPYAAQRRIEKPGPERIRLLPIAKNLLLAPLVAIGSGEAERVCYLPAGKSPSFLLCGQCIVYT